MNFIETPLSGTFLVDPKPHEDARGFFARTFCEKQFQQQSLETHFMEPVY